MKKYIADWTIKENKMLQANYCLLTLTLDQSLPPVLPGQFVQIQIPNSDDTFLRRPISVHSIDKSHNELQLLIQIVGKGTRRLAELKAGELLNLIYPLGNSFSMPPKGISAKRLLLIGGGVGVAPLLFLGQHLKEQGFTSEFLLGARSQKDLLQLAEFQKTGTVHLTTEDGSAGEKGYVTDHSVLKAGDAGFIYTCGPQVMMQAVARYARQHHISCEVSLENRMACGIGACLCCVEKTKNGNTCVCTEGPVFNIDELTWQI